MRPYESLVADREIPENDKRRLFTKKQRAEIFRKAGGKCELCGEKVLGGWIAGHIVPHWSGGKTEVDNGRVEGVACGCAGKTKKVDAKLAAKNKRIRGLTRTKRTKIKSRGFDKRFKKRFNGDVVENEENNANCENEHSSGGT